MTNTLIDALNDDDSRDALHAMLLATAIRPLDYNDDDLDTCCDCNTNPDDCIHFAHAHRLHDDYIELLHNERERDMLTEIALALSLCPIHLCDYAICFDDNDAECATIRLIHPSHDT